MKRERVLACVVIGVVLLGLLLGIVLSRWRPSGDSVAPTRRQLVTVHEKSGGGSRDHMKVTSSGLEKTQQTRQVLEAATVKKVAVLVIKDGSGRGLPGATVFALFGEDLLWQVTTNTEGLVEVKADPRDISLVVAAPGMTLHQETITLSPGHHVIELLAGECVTGVVFQSDGKGIGDLELVLSSEHPIPSNSFVPTAVWDILRKKPGNRSHLFVRTEVDGSFEFRGLPVNWSGDLRFPISHFVDDASVGEVSFTKRHLHLSRPCAGIRIILAGSPTLRGRLVHAANGTHVANVQLTSQVFLAEYGHPDFGLVASDEEGKFAISLPRQDIHRLSLGVGRPPNVLPILELSGADIPEDLNLGDIALPMLRDIPFALRGQNGIPVSNGIVTVAGIRSEPSDASGLGIVLQVPLQASRLRAVADGFVPTTVALPELLSGPVEIVMEAANRLEVQLVAPTPADLNQFQVMLGCDSGLLHETNPDRLDWYAIRDHVEKPTLLPPKIDPRAGIVSVGGLPNEEGVVVFKALQAGRMFVLEISGQRGSPVYHEEAVAALSPTEIRRVVIDLGEMMRIFRGRVLDPNGTPLVSARVKLGGEELGLTNEQGTFRFHCAQREPATLTVSHPAYAPLYLREFTIPYDASRVELQLSAAHRVMITVTDPSGSIVPEAEVFVRQEGYSKRCRPLSNGTFEVSGLSDAPMHVKVRLGGRYYQQDHDPSMPEATIEVPNHGRVVMKWAGRLRHDGEGGHLVIVQSTDSDEVIRMTQSIQSPDQTQVVFPHVLPGAYEASLIYLPSSEEPTTGEGLTILAGPVSLQVQVGSELVVFLPGH